MKKYAPSKSLTGILCMLAHSIVVSMIYIIAKKLTAIIPPEQLTFMYKLGVLLSILPWCSKGGLVKNIRTTKIHLHIARGLFSAIGTISFYYGLKSIQAIDAVAVTYMEGVIILFVGIFYFKEKITNCKIIMIILCVIGTLFITKPGFKEFNSGYVFLFLALIAWAINNLSIKILGKTEHSRAQAFYAALFGSLFALILSMQNGWQNFDLKYIKYIMILTILYFIHTITFFKAFKLADMSTIMPFDYTRLIFTGILGYVLLQEVPDLFSLIGYLLISLGGIYLMIEEGKNNGWSKETEKQFKSDVAST